MRVHGAPCHTRTKPGVTPGTNKIVHPLNQKKKSGKSELIRIFYQGGAGPPVQKMIRVIDEHRKVHGVEPICKVLPIARQAIMPVSQYSAIQINSLFGQGGIWL